MNVRDNLREAADKIIADHNRLTSYVKQLEEQLRYIRAQAHRAAKDVEQTTVLVKYCLKLHH